MRLILLALLLAGCASQPVNYSDPERCWRVYAKEVLRMQQDYDPDTSPRDAVLVRELKPVADSPELTRIVEFTVDFLYANFYLPPRQLKARYVEACEARLKGGTK